MIITERRVNKWKEIAEYSQFPVQYYRRYCFTAGLNCHAGPMIDVNVETL